MRKFITSTMSGIIAGTASGVITYEHIKRKENRVRDTDDRRKSAAQQVKLCVLLCVAVFNGTHWDIFCKTDYHI